MKNEDQVQCVFDFSRDFVLAVRLRKHHVQEIRAVAQARIGVDHRQPHRAPVGERGNGADLADQARGDLLEMFRVVHHKVFLVDACQVIQGRRQYCHRRRIGRDMLEQVLYVLVQQLARGQLPAERVEFVG